MTFLPRQLERLNKLPITEAQRALIVDINAYAASHYEDGYDTIIECWEGTDYVEFCNIGNDDPDTYPEITTLESFLVAYNTVIEVWAERNSASEW